jgi:hypothetical protein
MQQIEMVALETGSLGVLRTDEGLFVEQESLFPLVINCLVQDFQLPAQTVLDSGLQLVRGASPEMVLPRGNQELVHIIAVEWLLTGIYTLLGDERTQQVRSIHDELLAMDNNSSLATP